MTKITKTKYLGNSPDAATEIVIEEISNDTDDRIFELEKQLHEQYAVNNNSNAGILVSLISALLISFTGYGYVLYQYSIGECAIGMVNLAAITVMGVMTLLYCISVNLGAGQRMEQFITFGIRVKYYQDKPDEYRKVFPSGYTPFDKDFWNFVQGIYNMWTKATIIAIFAISVIHYYATNTVGIVSILGLLFIIVSLLYRCWKYKDYAKREKVEREKHRAFIAQIKNEIEEICVCDRVFYIIVTSIIVYMLLFIIISGIHPQSNIEYFMQNDKNSITLNIENLKINNK